MKLRTELEIKKVEDLIHPNSSILSIGSCFADNIGVKLQDADFDIAVNPLGFIFNPFSILNSLLTAKNDVIDESMYLESNGHSFNYNFQLLHYILATGSI